MKYIYLRKCHRTHGLRRNLQVRFKRVYELYILNNV